MGRSIWLFCSLIMLISRHWPFSIYYPAISTGPLLGWWRSFALCEFSVHALQLELQFWWLVFHWYICWHVIILGFYTEQNIFNPVWHHTTQLHLLFQIHHYNNVRLARRTLHDREKKIYCNFQINSFFTSFIFPTLEYSFHDGGAHHS